MLIQWVIPIPTSEATKVWAEIARATDLNILGTSARIATSASIDYPDHRLIAVQTVDSSDHEDVERVLHRLEGMGIVNRTSTPPIEYQTEAYYYLGIGPNNVHNLPTAFYTSEQFFNEELRAKLSPWLPGQILDESVLRKSNEFGRKKVEIADFGRIWNQEPEEKKDVWIPPQMLVQRDPNVFQQLEIAKAEAENAKSKRKKAKRMTMKEWEETMKEWAETEGGTDPVALTLNAKRVD